MPALSDDYWMARAVALAQNGVGRTSPNPAVGCVVVRESEVVGEGYHPGAGQPHAEVFALEAAGPEARGSTAYVTLEPCSTHGQTPPCTEALIQAGVARVVYGTLDPNPAHSGKSTKLLEAAGVATARAGDEALLRSLNRGFFSWMERGRPFVSAKVAVTIDGRVALAEGERSHISGPAADLWVHRWRAAADAVLVGIRTVLADDPLLTARPPEGCPRQPVRVVLDSEAALPVASQLVATAGRVPLVVVTTSAADEERVHALEAAGAKVIRAPRSNGRVDLGAALRLLGSEGILEVAAECGPTLLATLVASGDLDLLHLLVTPWVGGRWDAPRWFEALAGSRIPVERWPMLGVERMGDDVLLTLETGAQDSGAATG
jgi:diaminohydroxyphosphoribosylaminopyrimidine deaminase/5-amino-6-(5-phosphoribosylamino)uracil reductase